MVTNAALAASAVANSSPCSGKPLYLLFEIPLVRQGGGIVTLLSRGALRRGHSRDKTGLTIDYVQDKIFVSKGQYLCAPEQGLY